MDIRSFLGKGKVLDGSEQSSKASTTTKTAANKKPSSTNTNTGVLFSVSPNSSNSDDVGAAEGNSIGRNGPTNSGLPFDVEHWSGGIWTPVKDASHSSSGVDLGNGGRKKILSSNDLFSKEKAPVLSQQKTWTVVETKKDKEMKAQLADKSAGYVLGSGSSNGLSFLARMRQQWAHADNGAARPIPPHQEAQTVDSTDKQQRELETSKPCMPCGGSEPQSNQKTSGFGNKPAPATTVTIHGDDGETACLSPSDHSFHNSFHVSSCEEDSWPTPEKYYTENKTSSVGHSRRKRTVIDCVSSDEEDCVLPTAFKRVKPAPKLQSSAFHDSSGSDPANVFQVVKTKNKLLLEDEVNVQKAASLWPAAKRFGAASDVSVKRTQETSQSGASGFTPAMVTSTPPTHTEPSHSSGAVSGTSVESAAEISVVVCPSCQRKMSAESINDHLDMCLS